MTDGFIFYASFYKAVRQLPAEARLEALTAIIEYGLGEEPEAEGIAGAILELVKPQIDANRRRRENGNKGGRPRRTEQKPNHNLDVTKTEANVSKAEANGTKVEPKDKDKVKVKDKEKDIDLVILAWNGLPSTVPQISKMTDTRKRKLIQRIEENGIDKVLAAIELVKRSDFLLGKDGKWHITFDWFIEPRNFTKVIEGNYQNRTPARNGFQRMENNSYDFDELERQLLEAQ